MNFVGISYFKISNYILDNKKKKKIPRDHVGCKLRSTKDGFERKMNRQSIIAHTVQRTSTSVTWGGGCLSWPYGMKET